MAGFAPASGDWTVDYDEFGNPVWRNRNARQVHHMYNMPGQLPPPPLPLSPRVPFGPETRCPQFPGQLPPPRPALSPRGTFGPETRNPQFPGHLPPPPPALSPRGAFAPETRYPQLPPGPNFPPFARPSPEFPPSNWPSERRMIPERPGNGSPPFTIDYIRSPAAAPQPPPPTLLVPTQRGQEAKHWTKRRDASGNEYYFNTLTMEWQHETPDCFKKYTTK